MKKRIVAAAAFAACLAMRAAVWPQSEPTEETPELPTPTAVIATQPEVPETPEIKEIIMPEKEKTDVTRPEPICESAAAPEPTSTQTPPASEAQAMLIAMKEQKQKNDLERSKRTLAKVDKRLAELTKILNKLYEDVVLGKISEERYQAMAPTYEEEQRSLSETRAQLEREIFQSNEVYDNIEKFLNLIRKYTDVEELNAYILNELIEKIVVHEKVVDEDGSKSQQIDIYYKYVGIVNPKKAYYTAEDQERQAQAMALPETTAEK